MRSAQLLACCIAVAFGVLSCAEAQPADRSRPDLRSVRVAVLYENITDWPFFGRTVKDVIRALRETHADFIFRGFWRWGPCPNTYDQLPLRVRDLFREHGYSYENLRYTLGEIKRELPHIIFCGAIPAQIINRRVVWNPVTGKVYRYPETWEMAFDPAKLGLPLTKRHVQWLIGRHHLWVPKETSEEEYDPTKASAYFPDLTDPRVQELMVSWARKQIECGADAIWIDALYWLAGGVARITKQPDHPAVMRVWQAATKIIDGIRAAGKQMGREVLVGVWGYVFANGKIDAPPPKLDFVTFTPTAQEVVTMQFDESVWRDRVAQIRAKLGDIPIFAFLDWSSTTRTPLGQFSQKLTPEQQRQFLKLADQFFTKLGIVFIYPLHGGFMGTDATVRSFGKSRGYDSQAPEFDTYETICALAAAKAGRKE